MNTRILKYALPKQTAFTIGMPLGSKILKLGVQQSDNIPGTTAFPLWNVQVVDKRDSDEEQTLQFTASDEATARAHFEDLGYVVNSVEPLSGQAPPLTATIVASRATTPTIWALVPFVIDASGGPLAARPTPTVDVRFISIPTGAAVPDGNWVYVGTLQLAGQAGEAVFHVFVDGTYVTVA